MPVFKFLDYDTDRYPFADILARDVFHVDPLSCFHTSYLKLKRERGGRNLLTHQDNMAARELLSSMDKENEFYKVYDSFIREVITIPLFHGKVTPIKPVFRVQMATLGQRERMAPGRGRHRLQSHDHRVDTICGHIGIQYHLGGNRL